MKRSSRKGRAGRLFALPTLCVLLLSCTSPAPPASTGTVEKETYGVWWSEETVGTQNGGAPAPIPDEYRYDTQVDPLVLDTGYAKEYLLLVNKEHPLGDLYAPTGLTRLTCNTTYEMELNGRAAQALYFMLAEMEADGIDVGNGGSDCTLSVTSAYRSYRVQETLFSGYVQREMASEGGFSTDAIAVLGYRYLYDNYTSKGLTTLTEEDARAVVLSYSAEAGRSEHQTGLCVDFITSDMNDSLTVDFETKAAFAWLRENAHAFGFILRYPKGKEEITGYSYEPWHYRFVGREAATEIRAAGITLEEYLFGIQ